jgi:hypothetical protein
MRILRTGVLCLALSFLARPVSAAPITIDFEGLADLESVTNQFAALGVTFTGAQALQAGISLNEIDFPPFSGSTAVWDSEVGGIRVDFATGATSVSGHFTYLAPLTMTAYAGATELGSVTSTFAENYTSSGNPAPNELLQLAFATSISHVIFTTGSESGPSFVLDDFAADIVDDVTPVPEPASGALLLIGAAAIAGWRRRQAS